MSIILNSPSKEFFEKYFEDFPTETLKHVTDIHIYGEFLNYDLTNFHAKAQFLSNLTSISLYNNKISQIPDCLLENCKNVKKIFISDNLVTELDEKLCISFPKLEILSLNYCRISTISPAIERLTNLTSLSLHNNNLTEIPNSIDKLTSLKYLHLNKNNFETIPPVIFENFKLLEIFDMSNNIISKVDDKICNLTLLQVLSLSSNNIKELPPDFGNIKSLKSLYLDHNPINQLPVSCKQLTKLYRLDITGTQLTHIQPEIFNHLSSMEWLILIDITGMQVKYNQDDYASFKRSYAQVKWLQNFYRTIYNFEVIF